MSNDFGTVTTQAISVEVENTHTVTTGGIEMICVGTFMMGQEVSGPDEFIRSPLTNGFYLGKYEVTQAQYESHGRE